MARTNSKTPEQRTAEREALLAALGDKVGALATSEEWVAYLRFVAAFRKYRTGSVGLFETREWVGLLSVGDIRGLVAVRDPNVGSPGSGPGLFELCFTG